MATRIINQATLNYTSGTSNVSTSSNTASITMQGPLEITKDSLETGYKINERITYNVFLTNTSASTLTGITIIDNLGTHELAAARSITPLTYTGPAKVFVDHTSSAAIAGTVSVNKDFVTFNYDSLAPGSTIMLQYTVKVNEYAEAVIGTSQITNLASATATGVNTPVTATHTLPLASYADVLIEKSMSPDPVVDGSILTYTFDISNFGTIDATEVSLRDSFNPSPEISSVIVDNTTTTDYTHIGGLFLYPGSESTYNYTIPKATFTKDAATGLVSVVPGKSSITVKGII